MNSDYLLKWRQPVDLCNGEVWCLLCGTDWILKYYLVDLRGLTQVICLMKEGLFVTVWRFVFQIKIVLITGCDNSITHISEETAYK
jgi:hypothetical protein